MIYPGTDLKFRITAEIPDFRLSEDGFEITVRDKYMRTVAHITKQDCLRDSQGAWYFTLRKVRSGWYYASFRAYREDEDFDSGRALYSDIQHLCTVGYCDRHAPLFSDCGEGSHKVCYEQVWTASVGGEDYLADCDGNYIYTSDGRRIQFLKETQETQDDTEDMTKVKMQMSGEEFLRQWEGRSPNGTIDTVPELYVAMRGISDARTVTEQIEEQVEEDEPERVTPEDLANFQV